MSPPFAVGFDFDHTLGRDNGLERTAFVLLAEDLGVPLDPGDDERRAQIDSLLAAFRSEKISLDDAVTRFVHSLDARMPGRDELAAQRYRELCYTLVGRVEAEDGAQAILDDLERRGIPVAILTNGWSPLQQKKIAAILEFRGPVLVSDELGVAKPARRAFARLAEVLGVEPGRAWYVGDNARGDIGGALAFGMNAIWFDEGTALYPPDLPPPTARITSLRQLPNLLPGATVGLENPRR